jgi:hypothetical protein
VLSSGRKVASRYATFALGIMISERAWLLVSGIGRGRNGQASVCGFTWEGIPDEENPAFRLVKV